LDGLTKRNLIKRYRTGDFAGLAKFPDSGDYSESGKWVNGEVCGVCAKPRADNYGS